MIVLILFMMLMLGLIVTNGLLLTLWLRSRDENSVLEKNRLRDKQIFAITLIVVMGVSASLLLNWISGMPEVVVYILMAYNSCFILALTYCLGRFILNIIEVRNELKEYSKEHTDEPKAGALKTKSKTQEKMKK